MLRESGGGGGLPSVRDALAEKEVLNKRKLNTRYVLLVVQVTDYPLVQSFSEPVTSETKSKRSSVKRETSKEDKSDRSISLSRRFMNLSGRVGRKVKTFVSRPIREPVMRRFVRRVESRKNLEPPSSKEEKLIHGEVSFPKLRRKTSVEKRRNGPDEVFTDTSQADFNLPSTSVAEDNLRRELKTACKLVTGNNDNGGKVIVNGRPFWVEEDQEENEDSDTADDLQLNAEVVLDVDDGKITLENMPHIQ
ncbi:hypothetical protein OESDEN_11755 [Oesophagostomum dentatum]|uniref:Uncharacterized protein n=1 Tax=Oesophagostomum dentatum TaxID=61180 RepID=A0A0B1SZ25_OESDE|nr:hypothetical protein OESDEN_11755 [Oesophagostomum dentatum]